MNKTRSVLLSAVAVLISLAAYQAGSASYRALPEPTVAVVRLSTVINQLEERGARENELQAYIGERDAMIESLKKHFETVKSEYDLLPAGAERRSKAEDLERITSQLRTETDLAKLLIDRRRGEVFAEIFTKIDAAVTELAQSRGYTLVFSDDQESMPPPNPSEQQARAAIYGRRLLYADSAVDISDELVQMMNNQWRVGQAP